MSFILLYSFFSAAMTALALEERGNTADYILFPIGICNKPLLLLVLLLLLLLLLLFQFGTKTFLSITDLSTILLESSRTD